MANIFKTYNNNSNENRFLAWKPMFLRQNIFSAHVEHNFPGSMEAAANVMAQRATLQDFKSWHFLLFKRR
jgi:hypothetical protein